MTHLDEGQILALRDGAALVQGSALDHLESCPSCRRSLEDSRARSASVAAFLGALDVAPGDLEAAREAVRRRVGAESARTADAVDLGARRASRPVRRAWWSASKAAGLLLVTGAGLSALPGSPVRRWLAERGAPAPEAVAPEALTAPASAAAPVDEGGVRMALDGSPLAVILSDVAPGTEVRLRWIPGREAAIFTGPESRFTSGVGRIEAAGASGVVRVELPREGNPVTLEVNGRVLLRTGAAGLEVSGPVVSRDEAGITFRLPPQGP